jgi:hypothetical protein
MANRHLARSIADMRFYEFRRQRAYKADHRSGWVVVADRGYPSTTTGSACGSVQPRQAAVRAAWDWPGLWRTPRPGPEGGQESGDIRGAFRRVRLWRGRRWLRSQDRHETRLGEAGKQHGIGFDTSEPIWIGLIERCEWAAPWG